MATYCVDADLDQAHGAVNIALWSDLDNDADPTKMDARKAEARAVAYDEINDVLRYCSYTVPLVTKAGGVPTTIKNLEANLAGVWLYEARGTMDFDERSGRVFHRLAFKLRTARRILEDIRTGRRKLDAV